jgi:hypothetical protein
MRNFVVILLLLSACRYFPVAPAQTPKDVKKEQGQSK